MKKIGLFTFALVFLINSAFAGIAEASANDPEFDEILALDISELTVTSVSKNEKKLSDAASAIYVITNEDLHRMGVTSIPEALRVVPGVEVAQINSHQWAVSARGFNGAFANKLLVVIDGRSVYTPAFSGVYWDDNDVLLEDVERIEVIRGPGAALWGSNAVNGVINIITKKASETNGTYLSQSFGTAEYSDTEGRFGQKLSSDSDYRVYIKDFKRGNSENHLTGSDNTDSWDRVQSGFRFDKGDAASKDSYTLQGDVYSGNEDNLSSGPILTPPYTAHYNTSDQSLGGNLLGRWNHEISPDSKTSLQVYLDNYTRDEFNDQQYLTTADIDFQHNININDRNQFIWGAGYRYTQEEIGGGFVIKFGPNDNNLSQGYNIGNAFLQDEYAVIPNKLFFTLGSKFEYNDYTNFEVEPNARLSWKVDEKQTIWGAISRAVRTPNIIEEKANIAIAAEPGAPTNVFRLFGNQDLSSEDLIAYELGYRIQPTTKISLDSTLFYNDYNHLKTFRTNGAPFASGDGTTTIPYIFDDLGHGSVYGFELAGNWNVSDKLRLSGSYSLLEMHLVPSSIGLTGSENENPKNQYSLREYYNVMPGVQFDNELYFVESINGGSATTGVSSYYRFDSRLAWEIRHGLEFSLIGRNLLDDRHQEFPGIYSADIGRSAIAKISWKF